ncbi:hypothetical protein [Mucilaginibacter segetis]|uniref:Uncharacterized protein n=1 Tax=Mucilaginibacter segetis TaxID=2793071 RepID=A0A934PNE2_9SPHI|nr:hypothetical protein [Mucilaginibacter segetis]MBK0377764.1 hypothetical protein [Mucilaginibacter segetis]
MIYLEPTGGLANRIRVIASGIWLKQKLNTGLTVVWNENYELRCPYHELFEPIEDIIMITKPPKFNYITRSQQHTFSGKVKAWIKNTSLGVNYCLTDEDYEKVDFTRSLKNTRTSILKLANALQPIIPTISFLNLFQ